MRKFRVYAPGRVNLIGEHTDYNMLPVMPLAVDKRITIEVEARDDNKVRLANTAVGTADTSFVISDNIPVVQRDWGNYARAASQALSKWAGKPLKGFNGTVSSNLPSASGLSSSSALLVASALAVMTVNDIHMEGLAFADLAADAERYVGTKGGGMDQCAIIMSREGYASKIDFDPLKVTPVRLPEDVDIIVANSMVKAEKSGAAKREYNRRVEGCRKGLDMLKKAAGIDCGPYLRDFKVAVPDYMPYIAKMPVGDERDFCEHVLTEADRVEAAFAASSAEELGYLMNLSHESCANLYKISTPELDKIVRVAREAGALGARLTGAGFGGCAVVMARKSDVPGVLDALNKEYYGGNATENVLFTVRPSGGAHVKEE